jgi:putative hemin transport protein
METLNLSIKEQYNKIKEEQPKARIRDIARMMGVGEAQLVATGIGETATLLEGDFREMIKEIAVMGKVMALTRNDNVVHERKGVYNNVSFEGGGMVGLVLDPDIDLRLFMIHWKFGFAVNEGDRKSLQFFDKSGDAVHKIYMTDDSDIAAYDTFVEKYKAVEQVSELTTEIYNADTPELPDADIDVQSFRGDWLAMKDSHEFFGLINKFKLKRTQALRLAPEAHVKKVPNDTARKMLEAASASQVPVMVFVGSRGCIQIHTGTVTKLLETGPWFNVLDPDFNMHLRQEAIAASYIVKKPSVDGIVTSLELFDSNGEMIVQFFGKRKPGIPELESWRELIKNIADF